MQIPFITLIALPLVASPLIYLSGRLPGRLHRLPFFLSLLTLLACWVPFYAAVQQLKVTSPLVFTLQDISLRFDGLSLLLAAVSLGLGTLVTVFSGPYLKDDAGEEKYYAMLTAMIGVMIALGSAGDLFNLWVWFEAMAVTSYLLVVFYREEPASLEAGIKYVVQSATGSVFVLMGIALVLSQTGTTDIATLAERLSLPVSQTALLAAGALFLIGFGVKSALVPLHTWLPDAHTQAPSGISAMLSGVVIEAGLIAMLRSLGALSGYQGTGIPITTWGPLLMAFGVLNMLVGNLMALRQTQVKRLLAYSSLSHMGYMLTGIGIAMAAGETAGAQGSLFHLLNHGLMKGLAFLAAGGLMYALGQAALHQPDPASPAHPPLTVRDLDGAARRYPLLALAFSLALLGLGGLPPLAGFMSKWQIFVAGFSAHNVWLGLLVVFAALNSVLSLAYYAPLVNAVYRKQPSPAVMQGGRLPALMSAPLILLALSVIALGLWPNLASWLTGPAGKALLAAFGG